MLGITKRPFAVFIVASLLSSCVTSPDSTMSSHAPASAETAKPSDVRTFPPFQENRTRESFVARGEKGMIASSHPIATAAGIKMLQLGGNAMDAAAAVSFAISVVRPHSTGIGGGGFLLYFDDHARKTAVYDFRERAPLKATTNMYLDKKGDPADFVYKGQTIPNASVNGHLAVGTPGLVAGVIESHAQHGKLPLKTVIQPAIDAAERGFPVYKGLAEVLEERKDVLKHFEGTAKIFFKNGEPLKEGDLLVQKDLAWTLKQIAERGRDGFYKGPVANLLVKEMQRGGGIMTQKDLDEYTVKAREPVVGTFRGHKVVSMPPPSSGGVHIVEILNVLEGFDLKRLGHNTPESINVLVEAMRYAYRDRAEYLGDPDFVEVPVAGLTSPKYAAEIRKQLAIGKAGDSANMGKVDPMAYESPSTTHLSVVDQWGNAVSSTQTINYSFGSGVIAQGTGVFLNDEMDDFSKKPGVPNAYGLVGSEANAIKAKKTMLSSMSPTLVFDPSGRLELVVGSPGGSRIITATLQTILNVVEYGENLEDAVHAYRVHHQWLPDQIFLEENGLRPDVEAKLREMGYQIAGSRDSIGDVQAIGRDGKSWIGVSDTRAEGAPMAY